jgi:hypothetical protein
MRPEQALRALLGIRDSDSEDAKTYVEYILHTKVLQYFRDYGTRFQGSNANLQRRYAPADATMYHALLSGDFTHTAEEIAQAVADLFSCKVLFEITPLETTTYVKAIKPWFPEVQRSIRRVLRVQVDSQSQWTPLKLDRAGVLVRPRNSSHKAGFLFRATSFAEPGQRVLLDALVEEFALDRISRLRFLAGIGDDARVFVTTIKDRIVQEARSALDYTSTKFESEVVAVLANEVLALSDVDRADFWTGKAIVAAAEDLYPDGVPANETLTRTNAEVKVVRASEMVLVTAVEAVANARGRYASGNSIRQLYYNQSNPLDFASFDTFGTQR